MLKGRARLRDALMLQCFLSLFAVKMRNVLMVVRCVAGPDQWRAASLSQWYKLSADCVAHPPHKCQTPDASALLRHDPETLPSGNPVPIHKARDPARPEAGQRGRAEFSASKCFRSRRAEIQPSPNIAGIASSHQKSSSIDRQAL